MHLADDFLKNTSAKKTQAWIAAQNKITLDTLTQDPRFIPCAEHILQNMQSAEQIPYIARYGAFCYNFLQDASHPKGVYRRQSMIAYQDKLDEWEIVLDIDDLAQAENMNWYLEGVDHCQLHPTRCLISLSEDGGDATVVREYDLDLKTWIHEGFEFPLGKNSITWRTLDEVFLSPAWDEAGLSQSGYPIELWLHQRHQSLEDAVCIFRAQTSDMQVSAWRFLDPHGPALDIVECSHSFYQKTYFTLDVNQVLTRLKIPSDFELQSYSHGFLVAKNTQDFHWQNQVFVTGSALLLQIDAHSGDLTHVQSLFTPKLGDSVLMLEASLHYIIILSLKQVQTHIQFFYYHDGLWLEKTHTLALSGVYEWVDQPWMSDDLYLSYSDFLSPATLIHIDIQNPNQTQILRTQVAAFDASPYKVEQHWAPSFDGCLIPYFQISAKNLLLDGNNPTLLYGYGGFEVSMLPYYLENMGHHWLDQGGVFIVANIRGGGEFGPQWHQAAIQEKREVSFKDFIAVAEDLQHHQVCKPARLAIQGGSNGGLLVAACMQMRPELFGAVVCEVPILDMCHYHQYLAGASWIDEYGDPDEPIMAATLKKYSPLEHIQIDVKYPIILLTTNTFDDRVHPLHARKMAYRMHEKNHQALFFESSSGGHSGLTEQSQTAKELALVLMFLYQNIMDIQT